jgi:hypothetical protein
MKNRQDQHGGKNERERSLSWSAPLPFGEFPQSGVQVAFWDKSRTLKATMRPTF